jgi:GPH family glycoside/pentoside/hexuronide:cation symporter
MTESTPAARHATAPGDRVPWREKIGLGLGRMVADGSHGTLHVLVNPIYNMTLGVNPAWLSTTLFVQRLVDAVLDPLWGRFSDNFRSRWGRRLPLLAAAVLPLALLFGALWWFPREASTNYLFGHFLLVSLVFYAAHSLYGMPLGGLLLEATDDYHERSRLVGVVIAFGFAFQIGSQWLFYLTHRFSDTITGLRWVTGGCVVFFIIAGFLPVLLCRERNYARVASRQPPTSVVAALRAVRTDRAFLALLGARFAAAFGYNLVGMLGIYMNNYYVCGGDLVQGAWVYSWIGSSFHVAAIIGSLWAFPWLARRFGKKRTLQIAAGVLITGCASKLVLYQPGHPWLQFFVLSANGASNAGLTLMATAMLGDIADLDEFRHGLRREALFTGLMNWAEKAGNSVGSWIAGFVLVGIGFNAKLGAQSPQTLTLMKYCYVVAPLAGAVLALWLIRRYDLTEARAYEIKDALAGRRAAAAISVS